MKKRFTLMLVVVLALSMLLTACGPNTKAYLEKTKEVAKWEAVESEYKGTVNVKFNETTQEEGSEKVKTETKEFKIPVEFKSYVINPDKAAIEYKVNLADIKKLAPSDEEFKKIFPKDELEFKMFVDGQKLIMPKELFTMQTMMGQELDILKGDEKYLAMDMNTSAIPGADMLKYQKMGKELGENLLKAFEAYKSDFDMGRDGEKFTYTFDTENGKSEIVKLVEFTKANSATILNTFAPLMKEMDPENSEKNMADIKAEIEKLNVEEIKAGLAGAMDLVKGSKLSGEVTFGENKVEQKVKMNLNVQDMFQMNMELTGVDKKAEVKKLELPKDVKTIKYEDYMEALTKASNLPFDQKEIMITYNKDFSENGSKTIEFDVKPLIEEGHTLVPARAFFEALGLEVEWNEKDNVVTAKKDNKTVVLTIGKDIALVDGKEVKLDKAPRMENDRTLVPLRFLAESFGLNVEFEQMPAMIFISMQTPEYKAEMDKMIKEIEKDK